MVMTISNFVGSADTFSWPYNPTVFDDVIDSNHQLTPIQFQRHHIVVTGAGRSAISIIMTGHFSGASRWTNFRLMSKHFSQTTQLKKLAFESDKFYLGIGKQVKKTHSGGRTLFIDYVATFEAIVSVLFGTTERTSGTNEGNTATYVHEITGTVTSGASNVTIIDAYGNEITIPASALSTSDVITYKLVELVDSGSGIYVSEYAYVEINGTQTKLVQTTGGFGVLQLGASANITTVVTSNLSSVTKKFRDAYSD